MGKKKQHRREPTAPPGDPGSGPPPAQRAAGTSVATAIVAAACGSAATAVVVTGPGHLAHAAFELGVRAMQTVSVAATVVADAVAILTAVAITAVLCCILRFVARRAAKLPAVLSCLSRRPLVVNRRACTSSVVKSCTPSSYQQVSRDVAVAALDVSTPAAGSIVAKSCTPLSHQQVSRDSAVVNQESHVVDADDAAKTDSGGNDCAGRRRDKKAIWQSSYYCQCDKFQPNLHEWPAYVDVCDEDVAVWRTFYAEHLGRAVSFGEISAVQARHAMRKNMRCKQCDKPEAPSVEHRDGKCACPVPMKAILPLTAYDETKLFIAELCASIRRELVEADPDIDEENRWLEHDRVFVHFVKGYDKPTCIKCRRTIAGSRPAVTDDDCDGALATDFILPSGDDKWDEKRQWLRDSGHPLFSDI